MERLRLTSATHTRLQAGAPSYVPYWSPTIDIWTRRFIDKNLWRVSAHIGDREDALQEARIVYLRCERRYSGVVDNAAWFMALYQRSLIAQFHDFANAATRQRDLVVSHSDLALVDEEGPQFDSVGELRNGGELSVMVRQAPNEVRMVLALLLNAPCELLELVAASTRKAQALGNKHLCLLLGITEDMDLLGRVREYFEGTGS